MRIMEGVARRLDSVLADQDSWGGCVRTFAPWAGMAWAVRCDVFVRTRGIVTPPQAAASVPQDGLATTAGEPVMLVIGERTV